VIFNGMTWHCAMPNNSDAERTALLIQYLPKFVKPMEDQVRGVRAEGVWMTKIGEAVGIASSDCPTIVARNVNSLKTVAAHAGRDSLYDRGRLEGGKSPRQYESVVDAIMRKLARDRIDSRNVRVFIACGIRQRCFNHPTDRGDGREWNARLVRHLQHRWGRAVVSDDGSGCIDMQKLIRRQFRDHGVDESQIDDDGRCTYEDMTKTDGYAWHSHRRDQDGKRNFVLTIRRR